MFFIQFLKHFLLSFSDNINSTSPPYFQGMSVDSPFIICFLYELVKGRMYLQAVFSAWKRHDLFMLIYMLCNHCLHARFAMVNFQKALASLFVCHAKFSSADAVFLHNLFVSWVVRFGFLFECFCGTFHPHPPVKTWWNYFGKKSQILHLPIPFTAMYFEIDYSNDFHMLYLFTFTSLLLLLKMYVSYVLNNSKLPWSHLNSATAMRHQQSTSSP